MTDDWPAIELKSAVEEAVGWLRSALDIATEDEGHWQAMDETALKIHAVLLEVEKLLPLHPEIEARVKDEWEQMCSHDSAERTRINQR